MFVTSWRSRHFFSQMQVANNKAMAQSFRTSHRTSDKKYILFPFNFSSSSFTKRIVFSTLASEVIEFFPIPFVFFWPDVSL